MGVTGAGKSSVGSHGWIFPLTHTCLQFINSYLGQEMAQVGHGLESCTATLQPFIKDLPQDESGNPRRLVLVDTPGFDNINGADSAILTQIEVWLASS